MANMSQVKETILANADYHTRLITAIGELEYVPSAIKFQKGHIVDLESQLATFRRELVPLVEQSEKKKNKHESLRDSTIKRFAYKLFGKVKKYEAKVKKKEREYVEAIQIQETAQNNHLPVKKLLTEGRQKLITLTAKEEQLLALTAELSALYCCVFDEPTEFFLKDNQLKHTLQTAKERHDKLEVKIQAGIQATEKLAKAKTFMDKCQGNRRLALAYLRRLAKPERPGKIEDFKDTAWLRGSLPDALHSAEVDALHVDQFVSEAINQFPTVKSVQHVHIPMSATLKEIELLTDDLLRYDQEFNNQISSVQSEIDESRKQLVEVSTAIDLCSQKLHKFRKAAFESCINHSKIWQPMVKNNIRRDVALVHAFPELEKHEAILTLTNTIVQYKDENQFESFFDDRFTPDPSRDMSIIILVAEEYSKFRGEMKEVAREVVKSHYSDVLSPPNLDGYEKVKDNVIEILKNRQFLRGGVDENGKTINLGHSSIEALALQFYYTGDNCIAKLFPEDFDSTIPDHAFALLMTCIQNCLEEYSDHGQLHDIGFEGVIYRRVYQNFLDIISDCQQDNYHGPQFETRRAEWANKGMQQLDETDHHSAVLCFD